jgi:hypothetical protein
MVDCARLGHEKADRGITPGRLEKQKARRSEP